MTSTPPTSSTPINTIPQIHDLQNDLTLPSLQSLDLFLDPHHTLFIPSEEYYRVDATASELNSECGTDTGGGTCY
eukprot:CAMPEP_0118666506 /NCGR_PEP_ID=MMETSP0785-20121206/19253_1 /TAXON_ID=91992 /ORGANISM="Bolidomonas pacifica, Strain CCMP 1866" /LENGTH=74 /DNA_ID=CAMNT_0006560825 /DNA_START=501 /DNA_END=725 /DNA_ORIENTATION=+